LGDTARLCSTVWQTTRTPVTIALDLPESWPATIHEPEAAYNAKGGNARMIDPEAIKDAKRELGRHLAACREAAGLNQHNLAPLIHYGRSTIANAETGRSTCSRTFWERCDEGVQAGGALLRRYDDLQDLIRIRRAQVARQNEANRIARFRATQDPRSMDGPDPDDSSPYGSDCHEATVPLADPAGYRSPQHDRDSVVLRLQFDGREVAVPFTRRLVLQSGLASLVEAFALEEQIDSLLDVTRDSGPVDRLTITSSAHVQEVLVHLREQWHALVKTDNLLGPRFALTGVLNQIGIVEALLPTLRDDIRRDAVRLGAQYAESAAWLYEDAGHMSRARFWTSRAMELAYEGDDERMLAWTIFRRSQQAAATPDAAQVIGLARAARRNEERLATPTRAAIRVQEAYGHALDGDEQAAQRLLDEAHTWAAGDTVGDARAGHGSYCTPGHIEIQRASCWLTTGKPKKAITLYEDALRTLPPVYQRNRAAALSHLAAAYVADGQLERGASTAHAALPATRSSGSRRILAEIKDLGVRLEPHRSLPAVADLLDDLAFGEQ
jgi:hypothetical protein